MNLPAVVGTLSDEAVEKNVLAQLALSPIDAETVGVAVEDFSIQAHREIFWAIVAIGSDGGEIDGIRLQSVLKQAGKLELAGGAGGVWDVLMLASVFNLAQLKHYAAMLLEYSALRTLHKIGMQIGHAVASGQSSDAIIQAASQSLATVSVKRAGSPWRSLGEFTRVAINEIDRAKKGEGGPKLKTGLKLVDAKYYQVLEPENLVIVAARPSMGKTALALGIALEVAEQGTTVGIISLEMSGASLAKRAILLGAEHLTLSALDHGTLTDRGWAELAEACQGIDAAPIYLTDDSTMNVATVARKARELHRSKGLGVLMVDYLQLIELNPRANSRNEAIQEVSRDMKILARELKIPVVLLSQLSRECEKRADRRPIMSDLRDSGAIEQDADVIWMIYRDEVYDQDSPDVGIAEMLIRKNRNGPVGEERVRFINQRTKFEDL